jgi:spore coat polysaccharide biosynthesis protein SpsF (cytidylyltransferase family)/aryl-alcohol dehydrogenase-like predicted oxidoreductase
VQRTRVVIQSRLSSSRLPGKALMPVGGMPLIELVARRASRSGHEVVVATSEEHYDDRIAEHLDRVGIAVVRGPLDDVLGRFVAATADLGPDDRVVRLTGDNPVTDAALVDELLAAMEVSGNIYGRVDIEQAPEGLGAEAFSVKVLRDAGEQAATPYDREHVTPWLRRELGELLFVPAQCPPDPRQYRCTIDVLADYDRVASLFADLADPVGMHWSELITELGCRIGAGSRFLPVRDGSELGQSALVLGGTPLGRLYAGPPGVSEAARVRRILERAVELGVTHVETGRADTDSEKALRVCGEPSLEGRLRVVVRVAPLNGLTAADDGRLAALSVESSLERSFAELGRRRADAVLFERAADALAGGGAAWARLQQYRATGEVGRIGVSVAAPAEVATIAGLEDLGYLELPLNVLDRRWPEGNPAQLLQEGGQVVVAAHSAFLQGRLLWSEGGHPDHDRVRGLVTELGRESVADLCLAYVLGHPWVSCVVVGATTPEQVAENVRLAALPPLSAAQCAAVDAALGLAVSVPR